MLHNLIANIMLQGMFYFHLTQTSNISHSVQVTHVAINPKT
jgi:hypothetical protein